jgi:hypothetical protein
VRTLELLSHIQLSQHDCHGWNVLHHAALESPKAFAYLLSQGLNPYATNYDGTTAVHLAFENSEHQHAFKSLVCNWDLDLQRISGLISGQDYQDWTQPTRPMTLKLIFRRLPKDYIAKEIDLNTNRNAKGSPLNQVARCDRIDVMKLLIRYGANLEVEVENQGTPLIAACLLGRLLAVRYLVRAGANLFGTKDGKLCSALQAAKEFPSVVEWLLVHRYTEQRKISTRSHENSELEIRDWSGPRSAGVIITGLYSPEPMGSSKDRVIELARIRRELRGEVVMINGFND